MSAPPPVDAPATPERHLLPDVLRGLAVLGILVVNMQDFAGFAELGQRGVDRVAQGLTDVFANGRFVSIFAMLFGWGAAGLIARRSRGVFVRRHLLLLLIGGAHFTLLWRGDIINMYATLASLLLLTARLSARGLLVAAAVLGGLGVVSVWPDSSAFGSVAGGSATVAFAPPALPGSYMGMVAERASQLGQELMNTAIFGPWVLALMCLGAAAQRVGLLERPHEHQTALRRLRFWGLGLGLPLGAALAWGNADPASPLHALALPLRLVGGLAMALGYVGVIGLLAATDRLGWLRPFAASGRLALTNYLTQSLVMTTLFYPYGLGQRGEWGAAPALLLSLGFGLLQVVWSGWWVRRHGAGPVERLLRLGVYGPKRPSLPAPPAPSA